MINYSFIIPHHNAPNLLERCLNSIPQRDDIEIIVVDDNSDEDKKAYSGRSDVRIIYIDAEHTKGAGRARNYGMKEATGKWFVFADCDDFFIKGFLYTLDRYKDQDLEVVYHKAKAADTNTLSPMSDLLQWHNGLFDSYDGSKDAGDFIRFRLHSPWWKMVRRSFIMHHDILFEEVPKGNDVFFSYQVGFFAKKIAVEKEPLYVYTFNPTGITNGKKNINVYLSILRNKVKIIEFYKFIHHPKWTQKNFRFWLKIIKKDGLGVFLKVMFAYLKNYHDIQSTKMEYVERIKSRMGKK